mmetsp:Transcript_17426/g.40210  ORF Transcript_17426/g.40210 Transcript_17426/m.40210 type:complete len:115 (-) Transcript_17426:53-397(-)
MSVALIKKKTPFTFDLMIRLLHEVGSKKSRKLRKKCTGLAFPKQTDVRVVGCWRGRGRRKHDRSIEASWSVRPSKASGTVSAGTIIDGEGNGERRLRPQPRAIASTTARAPQEA